MNIYDIVEFNLIIDYVNYDFNYLFDVLIEKLYLKNDVVLLCVLEVVLLVISKICYCCLLVGVLLLICMYEVSELLICELCELMGDCCEKFCISDK